LVAKNSQSRRLLSVLVPIFLLQMYEIYLKTGLVQKNNLAICRHFMCGANKLRAEKPAAT
jgi:hypothetical protein